MAARLAAVGVVALCAFAAPASAAEPKKSATRTSSNGLFAIRLVDLGEKKCRVEVMKDQEVAYDLPECVGTVDDLYFVANDGERFWVLRTLPEIPAAVKKKQKDSPLLGATVAVLYSRDGTRVGWRQLNDFLPAKRLSQVRQLGKHFKWLEGVLGIPGKGPRLNDQNEVELEAAGGKTVKLTF